ncbi:LL-diaminopimelate aminotransferase [Lentibacillus sp. N15]|uniref:LL-diaminopimelate aminotransferase n=1 Tax=Lentibacillus songyuanensis TaxID=3136161 RepID=UPI0031BBA68B
MEVASTKVASLPPYLFAAFQKKKQELMASGVDVIDLGIGAPDLPTPDFIIDKLVEAVQDSTNHRYSTYSGCQEYREAVAAFYQKYYGVGLDPQTEVLALIGSKEGIANLMQAVLNPGDTVLVPDPGYPAYRTAVHLAGGRSVPLTLDANHGYIPLFDQISATDKEKAKMMVLNYPSNPTAATISLNTFMEAITFSCENQMLLAHDAAYDLVTFGDYQAPSVLQVPHAKDVAVEFGSLSKSFNMTGWRIGYVVGNKTVIQALSTLKSNIDTSQFLPIQQAAAAALRSDLTAVVAHTAIFQERMEKLHQALNEAGIEAAKPKGTIFMWAKVPAGFTSMAFANKLLEEAGIIVTPGTAFGDSGEGYFRIALTVASSRLEEAVKRLKTVNWKGETET